MKPLHEMGACGVNPHPVLDTCEVREILVLVVTLRELIALSATGQVLYSISPLVQAAMDLQSDIQQASMSSE